MKIIAIILVLISVCFSRLKATERSVIDSLIHVSMELLIVETKKYYPNSINYFSTENYPPGFHFPDTIDNIDVRYFNFQDEYNSKKIFKKWQLTLTLGYLSINKNLIRISYSIHSSRIKKKYYIEKIAHCGFDCYFEYDCIKNKWILSSSKFRCV